MIQYEKIELDYQLPIKLLDIYFEDHHTKTAKHYHNSIEILIPVLGTLKLFLNDKEILIPQGSLYIINSAWYIRDYNTFKRMEIVKFF